MRLKKMLGCVLSLGLLLSPISVHAEEDAGYVAYAIEGNRVFTSIEEAWNMAKQGRYEVYLNKDWNIDWLLIMYSGDHATLNLNGHSITRQLDSEIDDGEVIYMNENSSLTLNGGEDRTFTVKSYANRSKQETLVDVTTGGIITGGKNSNGGGAIHMKANCTLTLNHVGIVGNYAEGSFATYGGGVQLDEENCTLNMNDGAMISYNNGHHGGGVLVDAEDGVINMNASEISNNYANDGGGIFSNEDATYITLDKGSKITNNCANYGGGVYFNNSYAHINSNDSTGKISSNAANGDINNTNPHGGGICFGAAIFSDDIATVKNITLENNTTNTTNQEYKKSRGGGIYTNLANVEIDNCTFKNNKSKEGGALYILEEGITFKDCTITNNSASNQGGAIFVNSMYDITISGKMVVKDNTKEDGNTSNIYLENGKFTRAYISGTPDSGSEVGLTGDGDCKVGIKQSSDNGSFFVDNPSSYHLQYDDGKLYQRNGATSSIFGNGNMGIACIVIVGIALIGFVVYKKKKVE